ncbi:3-hydroxyacyl-ACP dehydratase FabZ [Kibdelosporangium lantanae]
MIDTTCVKRIIPHRPPVLAVDRVSEVEPGRFLVAQHDVTGDCPVGRLMESWAQAAVLLARWEDPNPDVSTGHVELLSGIRKAEVLGDVGPGDVLEHRVELVRAIDDAAVFTGTSQVNGRLVLRVGSLTVAHRPVHVLQEER